MNFEANPEGGIKEAGQETAPATEEVKTEVAEETASAESTEAATEESSDTEESKEGEESGESAE